MAFFKTWKCRCLQIHHGHLKKTIFLNKELPYPIHRAATLVANVGDPSCLKFSIRVKLSGCIRIFFLLLYMFFLQLFARPKVAFIPFISSRDNILSWGAGALRFYVKSGFNVEKSKES